MRPSCLPVPVRQQLCKPAEQNFCKAECVLNLMIANLCVTPYYPQTYHSSLSVKSL